MWQNHVDRLIAISDPLSHAVVPLMNGLARRRILRAGATQHSTLFAEVITNYYAWGPTAVQQRSPGSRDDPGLPVLLVHGLGDSALTWSLMMGRLARDHATFAIDLPGYGLSGLPKGQGYARLHQMCDILMAFMREVIGRPALVVGNSMGGWLAVKLAWTAPELVRGIILIDAGGAPLEGRASWEPFVEAIGVADLRTVRMISRQMFASMPPPLLYLTQRGVQDVFQRQVVREFVATVQEDEFLRPEELRQLPVPAALIWGSMDRFLPRGSFEFFRDHLQGEQVLVLPRCGHLPQRERPLATARFIHAFAQRCAQAAPTGTAGRG